MTLIRLDVALTVLAWGFAIGAFIAEGRRNRGGFIPAVPFWGCLTLAATLAGTLAYWLPVAFGARP